VDGEDSVRELLGLDERASIVEIAAFAPPQGSFGEDLFDEETMLEEVEEVGENEVPLPKDLPEETLGLLAMEENLTPDPEIDEGLPEGRAYRSDLDDRIVVLEGISSAVVDGPVHQIAAGCWAVDARGAEPAMVLIGERERGIVIWGCGGEVRLYSIALR
jgi:hypothetical protein